MTEMSPRKKTTWALQVAQPSKEEKHF